MANDTTITVIGNLTADPQFEIKPSGLAIVIFTVASTPRTFDRTTNKWIDGEAMFLRCKAFRDLAEHVAESLTKGARVIVTGRLGQFNWETPEGEKRSMLKLDVDDIGPSLLWSTATVKKATRSNSNTASGGEVDPWASDTGTPVAAGVGAGAMSNEPPF